MYGSVCIQLTYISYADCENTCTLSSYHHQIGSMTHLPLCRDTMICAVSSVLYEFVIWPECFVGHSCSRSFCPESGPLSLTCSIINLVVILLMSGTWQIRVHRYNCPWMYVWQGCISILLAHDQDVASVWRLSGTFCRVCVWDWLSSPNYLPCNI